MHQHCEKYVQKNLKKSETQRAPKILSFRAKKASRRSRAKKVEGAPKGPTPVYFLFYKDKIAELKKQNPSILGGIFYNFQKIEFFRGKGIPTVENCW